MTLTGLIDDKIEIPHGVNVSLEGDTVTVKGPLGELQRTLSHPRVKLSMDDGVICVLCEYPRIRDKAMVGTFASHIKNMIHGVERGYTYRLKLVFSHFPMKVNLNEAERCVEVHNYMGGHATRKAYIVGDTKVEIKGDEITVSGIDKEACGQTAANLEKSTTRGGFDKRVFEDGIYIVQKPKREIPEEAEE